MAAMSNLAQYLAESRITQRKFAEMIGIDKSVVSRIAAGATLPSLETAIAIERASGGAVPANAWLRAGDQNRTLPGDADPVPRRGLRGSDPP